MGHDPTSARDAIGAAVVCPWRQVSLPFQPDFPGERQWNVGAAKFACVPSTRATSHKNWDALLAHLGADLDGVIKSLEWTRAAKINTGGEYLKAWLACVVREPFCHLPYLFFYSPEENSGKSTLGEALPLLIRPGVQQVDDCLTGSHFNGQLKNAVICTVEETDLSQYPLARSRIKQWVTGEFISIREMRRDAYTIPNTTHWIQTANYLQACPVWPGDTRISVIRVAPVKNEIYKGEFLPRLEKEAPHFLRTLFDFELPPLLGRLRLPVISTTEKCRAQEQNRTLLDLYLDECHECAGGRISFREFFESFHVWLPDNERRYWSRRKVSHGLPSRYPVGAGTDNIRFIGNLSLTDGGAPGDPLVLSPVGRLVTSKGE